MLCEKHSRSEHEILNSPFLNRKTTMERFIRLASLEGTSIRRSIHPNVVNRRRTRISTAFRIACQVTKYYWKGRRVRWRAFLGWTKPQACWDRTSFRKARDKDFAETSVNSEAPAFQNSLRGVNRIGIV